MIKKHALNLSLHGSRSTEYRTYALTRSATESPKYMYSGFGYICTFWDSAKPYVQVPPILTCQSTLETSVLINSDAVMYAVRSVVIIVVINIYTANQTSIQSLWIDIGVVYTAWSLVVTRARNKSTQCVELTNTFRFVLHR